MDDIDAKIMFAFAIVAMAIGVWIGFFCGRGAIREEAIGRNVAHYNEVTGVWEWTVKKAVE